MKKILLFITIFLLYSTLIVAQSVGINTTTPHASAILDIKSSTKGMLIPRTSSASRIAIANPAKGLMLYDTTTGSFWFYSGSAWISVADVNNTWSLSGNTGINPATRYIGTTDNQPLRFRVNNTWAGEIHPTASNVFLGVGAGQSNTVGQANTAIGEHSLFANTDGNFNTANGYYALAPNTTGYSNTALGSYALGANTTGFENTAVGRNALFVNTTGVWNTATGANALLSNTTGGGNTANGHGALYSNTVGYSNTATGDGALYLNNTGVNNTASGSEALKLNTVGNNNTANGSRSLFSNNTGNNNTATGNETLLNNSTGSSNTANGYLVLSSNTLGSENTAIGAYALYSNSIGSENTASGVNALFSNTSGSNNIANGYGALQNNISGNFNSANGFEALYSTTTGSDNTANGYFSLYYNSTGNRNTAVGVVALDHNTTGSNNIAIGYGSGTATYAANVFNTISIGNDDILNGYQNQVFLGNTSTGFIGGKVTWSTYSDARIKNTIQEDVKGLDFILRLRPVTYHVSNEAITALTGNKDTPDFPGKYDNEKVKYTGFIAQEVEQAAKAVGYDFSGYAAPKNQWGLYSISYEQFVVPLVKAMQEQQSIIEEMKKQMADMKKEIELLKK